MNRPRSDILERRAELLARLAGGSGFAAEARSTAPARLERMDIAGAIGLVNGRARQNLLLRKYVDDQSERLLVELRAHYHRRYWELAERSHWKTPQRDARKVLGVVHLVLDEALDPRRCRRCNGRGELWSRNAVPRSCDRCAGIGYRPLSERARARAAGIEYTAWRRRWASRAAALREAVELDELQALAELRI